MEALARTQPVTAFWVLPRGHLDFSLEIMKSLLILLRVSVPCAVAFRGSPGSSLCSAEWSILMGWVAGLERPSVFVTPAHQNGSFISDPCPRLCLPPACL